MSRMKHHFPGCQGGPDCNCDDREAEEEERESVDLSCSLSGEEVRGLLDTLWKARCDIWQTARVSEYNLTGHDPNFPTDPASDPPNPPNLIHRPGLNESYAIFKEVCVAITRLSRKARDETPTKISS